MQRVEDYANLVLWTKILFMKMTQDTGHGDLGMAPWLAEGKGELVILHISNSPYIMLQQPSDECDKRQVGKRQTVVTTPPPRCCATAFAIAGFSATQRIFRAMRPPTTRIYWIEFCSEEAHHV